LAAHFVSPTFPRLSHEAVEAIGAHDTGWGIYPGESNGVGDALLTRDGKPRSFIEFGPEDFTRAWKGSIDHAASLSAFGGLLVSRHFHSLGWHALKRPELAGSTEVIKAFLAAEESRQQELARGCDCAHANVNDGLKVLQFCDLLSLALCCAVSQDIEFPQCFGGVSVRMQLVSGVYELEPSPFQTDSVVRREIAFHVPARPYPGNGARELSFVLR
jgi:hypothetical protein